MNLLLIVGFMFYILISLTQNLSKEVPRTETRLTDNRQSKDEAGIYVTDTSERDYSRVRMIRCDRSVLPDSVIRSNSLFLKSI